MDSQELELSVAPDEMCRACLAAVDRTQLKPIFCNEILNGKIVAFPKVFELVTGEKLTRDNKLPTNVCTECKTKLRECFVFIEKLRNSADLLYEIFSIKKPIEPAALPAKVETKCTAIQTDPIASESTKQLVEPVLTTETGTQYESGHPTAAVEVTEATCQTEEWGGERRKTGNHSLRLNSLNVPPDYQSDEKSSTQTSEYKIAESITTPEVVSIALSDDGTQSNEDEKYEMILLADEPNEEERYALSRVNAKNTRTSNTADEEQEAEEEEEEEQAPLTLKQSLEITLDRSGSREIQECFYCDYGGRAVAARNHFDVHRQTLEFCLESIEYYRCTICCMVFIAQSDFDKHFKTPCTPVSPEQFVACPDTSKHESFYMNAMEVCVPKLKTFSLTVGDGYYRCARCSVQTKNFEEMQYHIRDHEVEDDRVEDVHMLWQANSLDQVHVCCFCQAQFADAMYIRQHLYLHQQNFYCPYECNVSFQKFLGLTRHIQRMHLKEIAKAKNPQAAMAAVAVTTFRCAPCGTSFFSEKSLTDHAKKHSRVRKYQCTECDRCFAQKSDLTTHLRIHTNERPYACQICGKTFRTTSHRRDHMSTHEVINKYECDVCLKLFKAERIMISHKRLHTGEKPYQCEVCSKEFARKQHLKLHSKIHLKVKTESIKA